MFGKPRKPIQPANPRVRLVLEQLECRWLPSVNVLTYHNDNASTGQNLSETILTPANVNFTTFGQVIADTVDGQIYTQPLYMSGLSIAGANHNVVFVGTEADSVFAFDANQAGDPLWQDTLLRPGERPLTPDDVGGAVLISPQIGITGTPVINAATGTLYVVTDATTAPAGTSADVTNTVQRLHALDITTGAEKFGGPVDIQGSVSGTGDGNDGQGNVPFNPLTELQRPALLLSQGVVYIAWASFADLDPYHGWVMGYAAATLNQVAVFNATPNGSRGGIWESGGALATDDQGNLYLETGNGSFDGTTPPGAFPADANYGDAFLKLAVDPSGTLNANGWGLRVADFFTPFNQQDLSDQDTDLGSGAPLLLPDVLGSPAHRHLLLGGGKEGRIYLIDRDNMGKFDSTTDHVVQETSPGVVNGIFGTPALFNNSFYYVPAFGDIAQAFSVAGGAFSGPTSQSSDSFGWPGATPSLSANGTSNGIVWVLDRYLTELRAYDATDLSNELYTSDQAPDRQDQPGPLVKFSVPTVADGLVFVGTDSQLFVYGLRNLPTPSPDQAGSASRVRAVEQPAHLHSSSLAQAPATAQGSALDLFTSQVAMGFNTVSGFLFTRLTNPGAAELPIAAQRIGAPALGSPGALPAAQPARNVDVRRLLPERQGRLLAHELSQLRLLGLSLDVQVLPEDPA